MTGSIFRYEKSRLFVQAAEILVEMKRIELLAS